MLMLNKYAYGLMAAGTLLLAACNGDGDSTAASGAAVSELCVLSTRSGVDGYIVTCAGDSVATLSPGSAGASCSVKKLSDSSGYKVICGGDSVGVLLNGSNGSSGADGTSGDSCGVSPLSDSSGYKVVCGGDSVGVLRNGSDGADGDSGVSCTLKDNGDGTVTQTCGDSTSVLYKAVCGTAPYDPAYKFCVGVSLYNLCGSAAYDPASQFCDTRDSSIYGMTAVGTTMWMSQNLKYKAAASSCYGDSSACSGYGRLYAWDAADSACPAGWRLPAGADWDSLEAYVDRNNGSEGIGTSLKAQSGWLLNAATQEGTDRYGFSAVPAGYYNGTAYAGVDTVAYFWGAATAVDEAMTYHLSYNDTGMGGLAVSKSYRVSVRCVRN